AAANLLMATAEGRIAQFVRSGFTRSPTENWQEQWALLLNGFFRQAVSTPLAGQTGSAAS
ncbi:MAG TPA: nucleoid occlusion factor SlmA, partial [Halieaceae bacterium]|nr:nucleoid occlusion factor SlmA [Halieaceae bacterium]